MSRDPIEEQGCEGDVQTIDEALKNEERKRKAEQEKKGPAPSPGGQAPSPGAGGKPQR